MAAVQIGLEEPEILAGGPRLDRSPDEIFIGSQNPALISAGFEIRNIDPNRTARIAVWTRGAISNALAASKPSAAELIMECVRIVLGKMREAFALNLTR